LSDPIPHSLVRTLREVPLFGAISDDELLDLVGESANLYWEEGERIFEAGDDPEALFVVVSGTVTVGGDDGEGRASGPGTCLGEDAVIAAHPYRESAWVTAEAELMVIPADAVRDVLLEGERD
jgi:CRP-like cAMP-binding protein